MTTLRSAYTLSLLSFVVKGLSALAVTYWVANAVSVAEFGLWSTIFSLGIVFSVADFGVGQLIVTGYHERRLDSVSDRLLLTNAVVAMSVIAVILLVSTIVFLDGNQLLHVQWRPLLFLVIVMRLVLIPYGAVLAAHAKYHERKAIEAVSYAIGAAFVFTAIKVGAGLSTLLMGINLAITAGSVGIALRSKSVMDLRPDFSGVGPRSILGILRASLPYFLHNISGLAVYGGFVAVSALVLDAESTARLALLHTIIFMHLYQVFDLIFRTVQTEFHNERLVTRLKVGLAVSFVGSVIVLGVFGPLAIEFVFRKYAYSSVELVLYLTFVFLELNYLLLTTRLQMDSSQKTVLRNLAIIKTVGFVAVISIASILRNHGGLSIFFSLLCCYSFTMSVGARRYSIAKQVGLAGV